jgi:hypothetical protein
MKFLAAALMLGLGAAHASSRNALKEPRTQDPYRRAVPPQEVTPNCTAVRFSGEVTREAKYAHTLPDNLEFRLVPFPEGWTIFIGRPGDETQNYVAIATPPYHGANPVFIEAWHFRNTDNTGPNEGQVNAPGNVRDFSFLLTEADYKKFSDELNVWSGSKPDATEKERDEATDFLLSAPRQAGRLSISDMKIGGQGKGLRPWFDSLKFDVNLCFRPSAASPAGKANGANPEAQKKNP